MDDDKFLLVVVGQALVALGVSKELVRNIPEIQRLTQDLENRLKPYPGGFNELMLDADAADAFDSQAQQLLRLGAPLVRDVLRRCDARRIRPEILGVNPRNLDKVLRQCESVGSFKDLAPDQCRELQTLVVGPEDDAPADGEDARTSPYVMGRPCAPHRGEVTQLVRVIRSMPKATTRRMLPTRQPLILRWLISWALRAYRRHWTPPAQVDRNLQLTQAKLLATMRETASRRGLTLREYVDDLNKRHGPDLAIDLDRLLAAETRVR